MSYVLDIADVIDSDIVPGPRSDAPQPPSRPSPVPNTDGVTSSPLHANAIQIHPRVEDRSWRSDAACRGLPAERWFPTYDRTAERAAALAVCSSCPVQTECAIHGLRVEKFGIWGGLNERERHRARRALGVRLEAPTTNDFLPWNEIVHHQRKESAMPEVEAACDWCGKAIVWTRKGRPPKFCGPACKQARFRQDEQGRTKFKKETAQMSANGTLTPVRSAWLGSMAIDHRDGLVAAWADTADPQAFAHRLQSQPWVTGAAKRADVSVETLAADIIDYCGERVALPAPPDPEAQTVANWGRTSAGTIQHGQGRRDAMHVAQLELVEQAWHGALGEADRRGLAPSAAVGIFRETLAGYGWEDDRVARLVGEKQAALTP